MTLDGLMDAIKAVYLRAASGPLRDTAWRTIDGKARRDLQSYLRHNPQRIRLDYSFHCVLDTDGRNQFNNRGIEGARRSWIRELTGPALPDKSLEVSGSVTCRNGGRAVIEITARARDLSSLSIRRGSSAGGGSGGSRSRDEGSSAGVREGSDLSRLASLSGETAGTARTARGQGPQEEPAEGSGRGR